jgi:hypothetical protein
VRQALKDFELSYAAPFGFEACVHSSEQDPQIRGTRAYMSRQMCASGHLLNNPASSMTTPIPKSLIA